MFEIKLKFRVRPGLLKDVQDIKNEKLKSIGTKVIDAARSSIDRQFSSEGSASGRPWQSLSKKYEKWKIKRFGIKPILERTGLLREKIKLFVSSQTRTSIVVEARVPLSYPITENVVRKDDFGKDRIIKRIVRRKISYSTLKEKGKQPIRQFLKVRYGVFHEFGIGLPQRKWLDEEDKKLAEEIRDIIVNADIYDLGS